MRLKNHKIPHIHPNFRVCLPLNRHQLKINAFSAKFNVCANCLLLPWIKICLDFALQAQIFTQKNTSWLGQLGSPVIDRFGWDFETEVWSRLWVWRLMELLGPNHGRHFEFEITSTCKGWLAIAKLKPLSLFISLLLMPNEAFDNVKIEKWKVKVVPALQ